MPRGLNSIARAHAYSNIIIIVLKRFIQLVRSIT